MASGGVHNLPGSFLTPSRPDCSFIQLIHRDHDGYISFHRQHPDDSAGLQNLCSVPACALPGAFEQLAAGVGKDGYFSINAFFRGKPWNNRFGYQDSAGCPFPAAHRDHNSVRWLTSCFVDLDCFKAGLDPDRGIEAVMVAQDSGLIPPASIVTRSGRGIWLFWLLTGQDYKPPLPHAAAWPERCELWQQIQAAICERLATIGSDAGARDLVRITRIPGSINSKANMRVTFGQQLNPAGQIPLYTLRELAGRFDIRLQPRPKPQTRRQPANIYQERAHKGQAGRWLRARENFECLWRKRGGFPVGMRNNAVLYYAIILKSLPGKHRLTPSQIQHALLQLFRDLEQRPGDRYPQDKLVSTIKRVRRCAAPIRNQTIADGLDITPQEAKFLPGWPAASRFTATTAPTVPLRRPDAARQRRSLIQQHLMAQESVVPSAGALAAYLATKGLPRPSRATVLSDLRSLGIVNPRSRIRSLPHEQANPRDLTARLPATPSDAPRQLPTTPPTPCSPCTETS